ncbi:MAG TPA: hypothetical protein VJS91_08830 [Nitrososphaeraceae archaeon]|nr:hypothetical protein [Nitrososphaeraceae archaeon]
MATDGSHNSASIRMLKVEFYIFPLNYLNKTTHQSLRSKHKAADGTSWLSLVHLSAEPYQLLYKPYEFFGTSIKYQYVNALTFHI